MKIFSKDMFLKMTGEGMFFSLIDFLTLKNLNKSKRVVVEIGNEWLKIMESVSFLKKVYITKCIFRRISEIKGNVSDEIGKIFEEMKLSKHSVLTYIPRHLVTVRIFKVPSNDEKEVADIVNLQVNKQTPYSREEIIFVHQIVDVDVEGYSKVVLVIVGRAIIRERIETLEKAGIKVEMVGMSSEANYNWFAQTYVPELVFEENSSMVLVDMDSNYSDFMVIRKNKLVFTRNSFIGAKHIIDGENGWREKFIDELSRSIGIYRGEDKDAQVARIFLSGAAGNVKNLDLDLSKKFNVPVESTSPSRGIEMKKGVNFLNDDKFKNISITPLVGSVLCKRDFQFDLTPSEEHIQGLMNEKRRHLTIMGILAVSIVMMVSLFMFAAFYNKNIYLASLKEKISQTEKQAGTVEKMRKRIDIIDEYLDAGGASINILSGIYSIVPEEIYLLTLTIEEKKQTILKGRAAAMSDVFKFVTLLEETDNFENVKASYTTTKEEKGVEYASFEIVCSYEEKQWSKS